jgi:hypothetical protein
MRCMTMVGVKTPSTTWKPAENALHTYSVPYDWPEDYVGD